MLLCIMLIAFLSDPAKLCAQVTVDSSVQVIEAPAEDTTAVYDEEYEEEEIASILMLSGTGNEVLVVLSNAFELSLVI